MRNKKLPAGDQGNIPDFSAKCTFCENDFEAGDITILEEKEQRVTLHTTCARCRTSAIFFLSNNQAGVMSLGMATDLDKDEVRSKFFREAVNADEVIDAHSMVSQNNFIESLE